MKKIVLFTVVMLLSLCVNAQDPKWMKVLEHSGTSVYVNTMVIDEEYGHRVFTITALDTEEARKRYKDLLSLKDLPAKLIIVYVFDWDWNMYTVGLLSIEDADGVNLFNQEFEYDWQPVRTREVQKVQQIGKKYYYKAQ